jgi:ATP-binding cassette, subfamily C, bacterial
MTLSNRVKTPNLLQFSSAECGIISLAIIFQYYGYYITVDQLRQTCGVTRDGSKASVLVKVAREHGFQADVLNVNYLCRSATITTAGFSAV